MDDRTFGYIIGIVILLIFSAFFSAADAAAANLNMTKFKALSEKGDKKAKAFVKFYDRSDIVFFSLLIYNSIINVTISVLSAILFMNIMESYGALVGVCVAAFVIILFGKVFPVCIAGEIAESFSIFAMPILKFFFMLMYPLTIPALLIKKLASKMTGSNEKEKTSHDELIQYVEDVKEEGALDENESDLIQNAIDFSEQIAEDILTPRVDIEAVPIDMPKEEIAKVFTDSMFSRLLVYDDSIDNVIGVIHQKDFYIGLGITPENISDIMTKPIFAPKSDKIGNLLHKLQGSNSHVAVIIDEYGGTLGMITLEDILEELVGEIWDEHDEIIEPIREISENKFVVDCTETLDNFFEKFELEEDGESSSISGWVMEKLGEIAKIGDSFEHENLKVTVTKADSRKVLELEVLVTPKLEDEEDEE